MVAAAQVVACAAAGNPWAMGRRAFVLDKSADDLDQPTASGQP